MCTIIIRHYLSAVISPLAYTLLQTSMNAMMTGVVCITAATSLALSLATVVKGFSYLLMDGDALVRAVQVCCASLAWSQKTTLPTGLKL